MILGHERIITDLKRLAGRRALHHGYLFWGAPRVGKKTVALALAHFLEVEDEPQKKNSAPAVLLDCFVIEPDENGVIGIDRVREVKNFLSQKPLRSAYRTLVIDDGHLLTAEAQQALLKVTESPPASGLIVLVAQNPEMLLMTLVSRFEKIYFSSVPRASIVKWLIEEHGVTRRRAEELAGQSFGQPGRAYAALHNAEFQALRESVRTMIALEGVRRSNFIKELVRRDDFHFKAFLDALIEEIALEKEFDLWHAALAVRRDAEHFNVNPRLQLENLFRHS